MNVANRITLFRIILIPLFIALFPIYPEAWVSHSSILAYLEGQGNCWTPWQTSCLLPPR